jgi:UDPglucose--hexose-1-phosphate uridylyltransferase
VIARHPLSGEPVIVAPERASRPHAPEVCPFCPGNESMTPPTLASTGEPWQVRAFANKYPFTDRHEVIVETRDHDRQFSAIEQPAEVVAMYVERFREMRDVTCRVLFKNHGGLSGASIAHMHAQLAGTDFVPPRVAREQAGFASGCPLCKVNTLTIDESEHFVRFAPAASSFMYEQWIVPRRHVANLDAITDAEIADLGETLQRASRGIEAISPAYNWLFMNFRDPGHWYIQAMPRLVTVAGFELATGTWIDVIEPAAAAARLRT